MKMVPSDTWVIHVPSMSFKMYHTVMQDPHSFSTVELIHCAAALEYSDSQDLEFPAVA